MKLKRWIFLLKREYHRDGGGKDSFHIAEAAYPKGPPPYNLTVMKGTKNVIISKAFSQFVTTHQVATDYFHWIEVRYYVCHDR